MRIAILMANTDESDFAQRHPKDGEKFRSLMRLARPDWDYPIYAVKDGVFPDDLESLDGAIITGSPASVNEGEAWMTRLERLVVTMVDRGIPLFGACFGHQIIAKALGGRVGPNPSGWVKGVVGAHYADGDIQGYASHTEQVLELPHGADPIASSEACEVAAFRFGDRVETTQYHPEMTASFFAALLDEYGPSLPKDVETRARQSMTTTPVRGEWARRIAAFFENVPQRARSVVG